MQPMPADPLLGTSRGGELARVQDREERAAAGGLARTSSELPAV